MERLQRTDDTILVQFETSEPVLLLPIRNAGKPLESPLTAVDGGVDWNVTAPRSRFSTLPDQLQLFGITFDVTAVHQEVQTDQFLTPRQQRWVRTTVEDGTTNLRRDRLSPNWLTRPVSRSPCAAKRSTGWRRSS